MELVPLAAVRDLRTGDPESPGSITVGNYADGPYMNFDIEDNQIQVVGNIALADNAWIGQADNYWAFDDTTNVIYSDTSNIVIGYTASYGYELQVVQEAATPQIATIAFSNTAHQAGNFYSAKATGTIAVPGYPNSGDEVGSWNALSWGDGQWETMARFIAVTSEAHSSGSFAGKYVLKLATSALGIGGAATTALTINPGSLIFPDGNYLGTSGGTKDVKVTFDSTNGHLKFDTDGTEHMLIDHLGRVLIGDTSAALSTGVELTLAADASSASMETIVAAGANATRTPALTWKRSRGTLASPTVNSSGDTLGEFTFQGWDSDSWESSARIRVTAKAQHAADDTPGYFRFYTTPIGSATPLERMRIDADGVVKAYKGAEIGDGGVTDFVGISATGQMTFDGEARIDWAKYTASAVDLSVGSTSDSVTDLQTHADGNIYNITEGNGGTPGIVLIVDFINVTAFNWVHIVGNYNGSSTHAVRIALYNWTTDAWDCFDSMNGIEIGLTDHSFFVPDDGDYVGVNSTESGDVRVRFNQDETGVPAHTLDLDVVSLQQ